MLKLFYGELEDVKYTGDGWFENQLGVEYILEDFSKKVIKGVDGCKVQSKDIVISPVLGSIPPKRLSGGCKSLICIKYTNWVFSITSMGKNCYRYLNEIAKDKDIILTCDDSVLLFKYGGFSEILFLNTGRVIKSDLDLIKEINKIKEMNN